MDMIYDTLNEDIIKRIENENTSNGKNIPSDIVAKFYLGAVFNVGIEWLRNKKKYTTEQLLNYIEELIPEEL